MKRFMIAGGVLAALVVGIVAVAGAGAQETTPEGDAAAVEGDRPVDHYLEVLADNLGITVEELEGAMTQSHIDLINEKVADGTITEEEAAEIIERIESGEGRLFPPFGGGRHGGGHGGHYGNFHRLVALVVGNSAEVLDMEVEDLKEELHDGHSLADIATAQGMDVERFKADLLVAIEADLDEKVADGAITQEMADRILEKITEFIDRIVEHVPGEGDHDGARPFDGPRPGGPGFRAPLSDADGVEATNTIFFN